MTFSEPCSTAVAKTPGSRFFNSQHKTQRNFPSSCFLSSRSSHKVTKKSSPKHTQTTTQTHNPNSFQNSLNLNMCRIKYKGQIWTVSTSFQCNNTQTSFDSLCQEQTERAFSYTEVLTRCLWDTFPIVCLLYPSKRGAGVTKTGPNLWITFYEITGLIQLHQCQMVPNICNWS